MLRAARSIGEQTPHFFHFVLAPESSKCRTWKIVGDRRIQDEGVFF